jgi:hypothetical protein
MLEFMDPSGVTGVVEHVVTTDADIRSEEADGLVRDLAMDLAGTLRLPGHRAALPEVGNLSTPPSRTFQAEELEKLFDATNADGLWLEIHNTYLMTAYFLALARSYRDVEPRGRVVEEWHHCHFQKISAFNLAVFYLSKIQDLVVRLLHESFGGDLIACDARNPEWERGLSLRGARDGLRRLRDERRLEDQEHDMILRAIDAPARATTAEVFLNYRRRLAHRITPSVDHPELSPALQDREGARSYDEHGRVTSVMWRIGAGPNKPEYSFEEIYDATTEVLRAVARMLVTLKGMPRFA